MRWLAVWERCWHARGLVWSQAGHSLGLGTYEKTWASAERGGDGESGVAESQMECAGDPEEGLPNVAAGTLALPCLSESGWPGGIEDHRYYAQRVGTRDR